MSLREKIEGLTTYNYSDSDGIPRAHLDRSEVLAAVEEADKAIEQLRTALILAAGSCRAIIDKIPDAPLSAIEHAQEVLSAATLLGCNQPPDADYPVHVVELRDRIAAVGAALGRVSFLFCEICGRYSERVTRWVAGSPLACDQCKSLADGRERAEHANRGAR